MIPSNAHRTQSEPVHCMPALVSISQGLPWLREGLRQNVARWGVGNLCQVHCQLSNDDMAENRGGCWDVTWSSHLVACSLFIYIYLLFFKVPNEF